MRECEKGCQKVVTTVNKKNINLYLQYLNHFSMDFYATDMSRSAVKYLSNDILYILVSYILSEILLKKKQKLFTFIIHSTRAPVYKKIHPGLYFPVFRANTSRGG